MISVAAEHVIIDLTTEDPEPNVADLGANEAAVSSETDKTNLTKASESKKIQQNRNLCTWML